MSRLKVLVSAATMHGSTEVIAEEIGHSLTEHGFDVTVAPPAQVRSAREYDAVVIGSAVYMGHWLAPAKDLAARLGDTAAGRPVWLFSSGPVGKPEGKMARAMAAEPAEVAQLRAATRARGHHIFPGRLDPKDLPALQRASTLLFPGLKGDFRDWGEVRQWADAIARELAAAEAGEA